MEVLRLIFKDDDDDDWLEEEDCGYKWILMYIVNDEDDVFFSDFEGDDDISSLVFKFKMIILKGIN